MRFAAFGQLPFAMLIGLSLGGSVLAEPKYRERIEYFDISGYVNSKREMWESIRDWGPSRSVSQYIVGQAQPRFSYSYKLRNIDNRCVFSKLDVGVRVVIRLPAWDLKNFAKPELQQYFGCILRTVTVHEKRHAQIAYEAAEKIEARFQEQLNRTSCIRFADRAKDIYRQVVSEHHRRQSDFDRRDYARKRYQLCDAGHAGPSADINSRPVRKRNALRQVPTRRFDQPATTTMSAPISSGPRIGQPDGGGPTRRTHQPQTGHVQAFETAQMLVSSAGLVVVAAASVFGLFIAFMWGASSYERRRELDALVDGADVVEDGPEPRDAEPVGEPRKGQRAQRPKPTGFGKRVRG